MSASSLTRRGKMLLSLVVGSSILAHGQTVHAVVPKQPEFHLVSMLRAIAQVETGTNDISRPCRKIGKAGERSAWQIKKVVWVKYTHAPFESASTNATLASVVAALHIQSLREIAEKKRLPVTFSIACAWNCGPRVGDYATRVSALYGEFSRQ